MQRALDKVQARFGQINGVIHAAGISSGGLVQLNTPDASETNLSAKVAGTMVLDSLLMLPAWTFSFCALRSIPLRPFWAN